MDSSERLPVLVVDDDRSTLAVIRTWLSTRGWTPECHTDPLLALDAYAARHHMAVVVDWHMPELDGLELVRRLRSMNQSRSAYVILVTSSEHSGLLSEAFEEGVDDFIRKPLEKIEFLARMKAARRVCLLDQEIRLRSEQDLERQMHSLALRRISALVGAVAHELRTPLGVVRLATDRLRIREDRVAPEARPILDRLDQGVNALTETLENVMETFGLSHRGPRWQEYRPGESVTEAVSLVKDSLQAGVELHKEIEPGLEDMTGNGDPVSVRRLASNLLLNAIRHTSTGSIHLKLSRCPNGVQLEVVDSGEGIQETLLPWLGEPLLLNSENSGFGHFVRGNGMGLALCRKIVQRHGGTFSIRSRPGAGTRISVTLRLDLPEPMTTEVPDHFYTQAGTP